MKEFQARINGGQALPLLACCASSAKDEAARRLSHKMLKGDRLNIYYAGSNQVLWQNIAFTDGEISSNRWYFA